LGTMLSEVGRREEALAVASEAVAIRRRWAEQNPDAYEPNLAAALNNLANRLLEAGRGEEALPTIEEASELYRRLAEANPGVYEPEVVASQSNIAGAYLAIGDVGRAVPLYERVLGDSIRVLGENHPTTLSIRSSLAGASIRSNLAILYESSGDAEPTFPLEGRPDLPRESDVENHSESDAAFAAFYRRQIASLVAFLIWQGADTSLAADLAQDAMIQVYQHWSEINHPEAWVRRVASRNLSRHVGQSVVHKEHSPYATVLLPNPNETAVWEEQNTIIRLLAQLPPRQRQVLAWTYDGFTPDEIARELQISDGAVRASLHSARRTLAQILKAPNE